MTDLKSDDTPLMKQYNELKAQVPGALLFFRMGDFYELFGDDAIEAAKLLEITLTSRDKNKPNPMPMAGVPHHAAQGYIQKLLASGKMVAIGEQVEDPATVKGKAIVRREIVRVLTPAVQFDSDSKDPAYLAMILPMLKSPGVSLLALLDPATGELRVGDPTPEKELLPLLGGLRIKHFLRHERLSIELRAAFDHAAEVLKEEAFIHDLNLEGAKSLLSAQWILKSLDGYFQEPEAILASALLVRYVLRSQRLERLTHLQLPRPLKRPGTMQLGSAAIEHLDLFGDPAQSLLGRIDRTVTSLGARELRSWVSEPLLEPAPIQARQEATREIATSHEVRDDLRHTLKQIYDLDRLCGRLSTGLAHPRDTLSLGQSLAELPRLKNLIARFSSEAAREDLSALDTIEARLNPLAEQILKSQNTDAPTHTREGGIFTMGTHPELDRLITLSENGERWLIELETKERAATGISTLKVRYNRVFGYYIEVTAAHASKVPAHYQRKQTMVGAERFFTEELKKFEEELLGSTQKRKVLEQELFENLCKALREAIPEVTRFARVIGRWDALCSLALLSSEDRWVFPTIDQSDELELLGSRHPVVDRAMGGGFVPNDVRFGSELERLAVITGPNMGGKSTLMRQVALCVVLGQMGAPIPARSARWGAIDAIFTRIGAQDAIAKGKSTFMVEMTELAHLLHYASSKSLILLDEIGRGTSTYDGMSVAWATLEWIAREIKARTLFATHFHELTLLAGQVPGLVNFHVAAESSAKKGGTLRFLYELRPGAAAESLGIQVAQLAGLPAPVIERAWQVLERLEAQSQASGSRVDHSQLDLFNEGGGTKNNASRSPRALPQTEPEPTPPPLFESELRGLKLEETSPKAALDFLFRIREQMEA